MKSNILMNNPLVSIIIPIYNAEPYLKQCLDSLSGQTYKNYEIIMVDDGSIDNSYIIEENFKNNNLNAKIIYQKNLFAGTARNNGMKIARGKYLLFLDADDYFEPDLVETAVKRAEEAEVDIVLFNGDKFDGNTSKHYINDNVKFPSKYYKKDVVKTSNISKYLFQRTSPVTWTKLFRTDFIKQNKIYFQETHNANDIFFVYNSLMHSETISLIDKVLVHNRRNISTNLQSNKDKSPSDFVYAHMSLLKEILGNEKLKIYKESLINHFIVEYFGFSKNVSMSSIKFIEEIVQNFMLKVDFSNIKESETFFPYLTNKLLIKFKYRKNNIFKRVYYFLLSVKNCIDIYGLKRAVRFYIAKFNILIKVKKI